MIGLVFADESEAKTLSKKVNVAKKSDAKNDSSEPVLFDCCTIAFTNPELQSNSAKLQVHPARRKQRRARLISQ